MFNTKEANACMKLISQLLYSIELLFYLSWGSGGMYTKFCTTYERCNSTWDRPTGSLMWATMRTLVLLKSTDWKLLLIFKISIYSMYTSAWLTCISVHHQNSGAHRSKNSVLDSFGLEFQKAVNCQVNAGNQDWVLWKKSTLNCRDISSAPKN